MAKIVTITQNKGGCGKTTTAANMGAALRLQGLDVLLLDLDGQANLTASLGVTPNGSTTYDAIKNPRGYIEPVRILGPEGKTCGVLDLLAACGDLSAVEGELSREPDKRDRMGVFLALYGDKYDVILIDTPPALGLLTINALYCADETIITVQPQYLAVSGLMQLTEAIDTVNTARRVPLNRRVLFTMYDNRKGLHRLTVEQVAASGFPTFTAKIRDNVALGEAPALGVDIFRYSPRSKGAEDYAALCAEWMKQAKIKHRNHGHK